MNTLLKLYNKIIASLKLLKLIYKKINFLIPFQYGSEKKLKSKLNI